MTPPHRRITASPYLTALQAGLLSHFTQIADAVDIPIVLYNVPGRTGTLAGMKEAALAIADGGSAPPHPPLTVIEGPGRACSSRSAAPRPQPQARPQPPSLSLTLA